jgi:hypothetical protein
MKNLILVLTVSFFSTALFGQAKEEPSTVTLLLKQRKNEIGLLASPVGIVLLGGSPSGQRMGLSYKRNSGKKYLFTSGIYYQGSQSPYPPKEFTIQIDGNKRNIQTVRERFGKGSLSLGLERRWKMKRIPALTKFLGAELTMGYGVNNQDVTRQWWELDSTNTEQKPGQELLLPVGNPSITYNKMVSTIYSGVALNAGLQLQISDRFYAMAQFSMAFELGFQEVQEKNNLTGESSSFKANVLDFNQRGLIGDIGLFYKF